MASISKLTAALFSGNQETTLALANLNFDFSLVKIDAPAQFRGVGESLTRQRRDAAEFGSSHITARKLGALFDQIVPSTPRLFEAYGIRASDIARHASSDAPKTTERGIFSSYIGADATSIWAAATSGRGAISVHLLACLLARIWTGPEATSIWTEIVAARKQELAQFDKDEPLLYASALASQTQVVLILNNLSLAVNSKPSTYESVLDAWFSALQCMENLLNGVSQGASNGGLLLALSCWHLYPDIIALGSTPVAQKDPLFPKGTTLTLSLDSSPGRSAAGVYWSLSLSHMRYYGAPMPTERHYAMDSSRFSFEQLMQVVLGATCSGWGSDASNPEAVAQFIASLSNGRASAWTNMLARAGTAFLKSTGTSRTLYRKLQNLGQKRGASILAKKGDHPPAVFGLTDFATFMRILKTPEYRTNILRKYSRRFFPEVDAYDVIIRFQVTPDYLSEQIEHPYLAHKATSPVSPVFFKVNRKRAADVSEDEFRYKRQERGEKEAMPDRNVTIEHQDIDEAFERYMLEEETNLKAVALVADERKSGPMTDALDQLSTGDAETPRVAVSLTMSSTGGGPAHRRFVYETASPVQVKGLVAELFGVVGPETAKENSVLYRWADPHVKIAYAGEGCFGNKFLWRRKFEELKALDDRDVWRLQFDLFRDPEKEIAKAYKFFLGDPKIAAMFVDSQVLQLSENDWQAPRWAGLRRIKRTVDLPDLQAAIASDAIDFSAMHHEIEACLKNTAYLKSLSALAVAEKVYEPLNEATINPAIVSTPISNTQWAENAVPQVNATARVSINRQATFACISYLETGCLDLRPSQFENVLAISSGDSIYVAAPLLYDPAEEQSEHAIRRLSGNVGKAGLILLVPPADPQVLQTSIDQWKIIDRNNFTGKFENTFTGTSLHLSFTDWSIPVDVGETGRGRRDAEAHLVESLVSVHDRSRWIADLDVLGALSKGSSQPDHKVFYRPRCKHANATALDPTTATQNLVTINNWEEFLEHPECPAVAMAHDNWEAKLALAVLGVRRGDRVYVNDMICRECFADLEEIGGPEYVAKALFLV